MKHKQVKILSGTVEKGAIKLPPGANVPDGTRVLVAVRCSQPSDSKIPPYPPDLEAEDVAFVQACRGRLARQLRNEDA